MQQTVYVVRGFCGGCRQPEEQFATELSARHRAAYLGKIYDAVIVGRRIVESKECSDGPLTAHAFGHRPAESG